jgi:hypothetical protein
MEKNKWLKERKEEEGEKDFMKRKKKEIIKRFVSGESQNPTAKKIRWFFIIETFNYMANKTKQREQLLKLLLQISILLNFQVLKVMF